MINSLFFSLILLGISAISSQIILIREFLTVFYGNELSIGFLLFVWLLGGSLGSAYAGKIFSSKNIIDDYKGYFSNAQIIISILLPLSIIFARLTRIIFGLKLGEIINIPIILLWSFASILPICSILGFMFVAACQLYEVKKGGREYKIINVYLLESIGGAIGGFLATFMLVKSFNNFEIAFILSLLNALSAYFLIKKGVSIDKARKFIYLSLSLFIILGGATGVIKKLDRYTLGLKWKGAALIDTKDSIYGNITIAKIKDQYTFFSNGLHMSSSADKLAAEESVHYAMLMHREPKNILLIGGGASEVINEILKYPFVEITYVELDPLIINFTNKYLKNEPWYKLDNPRVNIVNEDARFFIKNTNKHFDVVLINLPNPYNAQINRFYTLEFYNELSRVLNEGAILSFGLTSSENYVSGQLAGFLKTIYDTLDKVFPEIKIVPGETAYFLSSNKINSLTLDHNLIERYRISKNISADFVRQYYLFQKLSQDRINYINNRVRYGNAKKNFFYINTDFHPVSYYFDMILWSAYHSKIYSDILEKILKIDVWRLILLFSLFMLLFSFLSRKNDSFKGFATLFALGSTGFSEMAFQILIILSFQVIYGYVYNKIGILFASFMVGLSIGTFYISRRLNKILRLYESYIAIQALVLLYPIFLSAIFFVIIKFDINKMAGSDYIFTLLPFIAGFVGGLQYPIANKIYLNKKNIIPESAGMTYASDLLGSSIGAILISAFLIPLTGIYGTCFIVTFINFIAFLILLLGLRLNQV